MIVSNTTVAPIYLDKVMALLDGYTVESIILPDGEQYKTLETVNTIFDALLKSKFDRTSTLMPLVVEWWVISLALRQPRIKEGLTLFKSLRHYCLR